MPFKTTAALVRSAQVQVARLSAALLVLASLEA
jgi:hypothetical protein